jgi:hypothetical protein
MINRELRFTDIANGKLDNLEKSPSFKGVLKQVRKTLAYLETNLEARSLQTHPYESLSRRYGVKVFESYIQQKTPGAYRIFWHYGPDETNEKGTRIPVITVLDIVPHPHD